MIGQTADPAGATVGVRQGVARAAADPEWWERLAVGWARWRLHHPQLARWLAWVRTIVLWVALVALAVVYVVFPQFREGLRVWFWIYLLLVAWFLVARTKTVPWALVAGAFAVMLPASVPIGLVSMWLADRVGGVGRVGPSTVIAGMTEESLKLVPLAVLALVAPGRVRRFAVADWLLLGFACGLGFHAFEDLARRTAAAVLRPGLMEALDQTLARIRGTSPHGPGSGYAQYGFSLLGGASDTAQAGFAGHHVLTALVAVTVGLAVVAWRRGTLPWRAVALVAPPVAWLLVVTDHIGHNATARTGRAWAQADTATMPWLFRAAWNWLGHGYGRGWLLVALLLLALLVDAYRMRYAAEGVPAGAARVAGQAVRSLVARVAGDVKAILAAHARQPGESRLTAMAYGRLAAIALRHDRAAALAAGLPHDTGPARRTFRGAALGVLACLLAAGLLVAPALAETVGPALTGRPGWLAGQLDALGTWWDGLGLGGQAAVAAAIVALVALSGGSFGFGLGVSGVVTYLLDKSPGLATFSRNPARAVSGYLATTTPQGIVLDLAEFALTFARGNFAGAGRAARQNALRAFGPDAPHRPLGHPLLPPGGASGPPPTGLPGPDLPFVHQTNEFTCGAACGEMLARQLGVPVTEAQLFAHDNFSKGIASNDRLFGRGYYPQPLADALQDLAPVPGRTWKAAEIANPPADTFTATSLLHSVRSQLAESGSFIFRVEKGKHWIVVDGVTEDGLIAIRDPRGHAPILVTADHMLTNMGPTVEVVISKPD